MCFFVEIFQVKVRWILELFFLQTHKNPHSKHPKIVVKVIVNTQKGRVFVVYFYLHISSIDRVKWRGHKSLDKYLSIRRVNRSKKQKNLKINSDLAVLESYLISPDFLRYLISLLFGKKIDVQFYQYEKAKFVSLNLTYSVSHFSNTICLKRHQNFQVKKLKE